MSQSGAKETLGFQTEVKQLLDLMIHSLYSEPKIFLRELISNASDALDKRRFLGLSDSEQAKDTLKITLALDESEKTITISDTGIGMSRDDVMEHLGTIARSGTKEFLNQLSGDARQDSQLIGQFGVGFYSAFMVADKVSVHTRKADLGAEDAVLWESTGDGEYTLEPSSKEDIGTVITLHIKESAEDFLSAARLKQIVLEYSDHISFPIEMTESETKEVDGKEETTVSVNQINQARAVWTRLKSDISDEEYQSFYKHIAHDFDDPLAWSHNRVEGKHQYTTLLYVPKHAPFDLWNRDNPRGLKLYVQRVFIMDKVEQFLPLYLRFVKGIVDSNDLPLNVSREILQDSAVIESIKKGCVNKILGMIEKLAKEGGETYQSFWNAFGSTLKEGVGEDLHNKERIAKLVRFSTTSYETPEVSFEDYIARMPEGQNVIYYITAENLNAAMASPHLEIFKKKGLEVILFNERVDEWFVSHLGAFEGKSLQSVAQGALDLGELEDESVKDAQKQTEADFSEVIERVQAVLSECVESVRVTHRLTDSPSCVVAGSHGMSHQLQRMMKEAGQTVPELKPILELNPDHVLVQRLRETDAEEMFADKARVLLGQAILAEGGELPDAAGFVHALNRLLA